jgi:hypothetical protein
MTLTLLVVVLQPPLKPGLRLFLTASARSWPLWLSRSHRGSALLRLSRLSAACLVEYHR